MKKISLFLAGVLLLTGLLALKSSVFATNPADTQSAVCTGIGITDNTSGDCTVDNGSSVNSLIHTVIRILSFVVGVAAIIMIILAGFKYVTARGESAAIASAKTTLIYAFVGLLIAALAQVMVRFVFRQAVNPPKNPPACSTLAECAGRTN